MDYDELRKLVRTKAKEIAGVNNIVVKFSNNMKKYHALCYWQETPQVIRFNKMFVDLNKDNDQVLKELVIHECIHLIPGCSRHNKQFMKQCEKHGIGLYGYSVKYKDVKTSFVIHCEKCDNYLSYCIKPRITHCKKCNGILKIIDCNESG